MAARGWFSFGFPSPFCSSESAFRRPVSLRSLCSSQRSLRCRASNEAQASGENAAKEPQAKSSGRTFTWKTAATVGALTLTGDTIGQTLERHKRAEAVKRGVLAKSVDGHDFIRSLRMFSYGFIFYGPFSHVWYSALDKMFPKGDLAAFAAKVFLNQVILGPIVVAVVFGWNFVLQGKAKELPAKYQADFVKTTVRGWTFWVPASMINFGLVPLHMRVIYMSTCAIVWNTYLSLVSMKA